MKISYVIGIVFLALSCGQNSSTADLSSQNGRQVIVQDSKGTGFVFGKSYWEGAISFNLTCKMRPLNQSPSDYIDCPTELPIKVTDANKQNWNVSSSLESFRKLKLPVSVAGSDNVSWGFSSYTIRADISNVVYEITKTNPIPSTTIKPFIDKVMTLREIASDIPGVKLSFSVAAKFFDNFVAGTDCSRISIIARDRTFNLTASQPSVSVVDAIAPVKIMANPMCQTTRETTPENKDMDVDFTMTSITVGDPVM